MKIFDEFFEFEIAPNIKIITFLGCKRGIILNLFIIIEYIYYYILIVQNSKKSNK